MDSTGARRYGAGDWIDDRCRPCGQVRRHTVLAADGDGRPARVICDHCGSQHNFRGGEPAPLRGKPRSTSRGGPANPPLPLVDDDELIAREAPASEGATMSGDLEKLLRRIIREETGLTPVALADRFRGGELLLRPGREGLQEKSLPIETFFRKIVMLRNRLRVLEQQINGADVPDALKIKLQSYITGCYGTLTTFNVLFADDEDRFRGTGE